MNLIYVYKFPKGTSKESEVRLFSLVTRAGDGLKQDVPSEQQEELVCYAGNRALAQAALGSCGISLLLEDLQKAPRHGPGQLFCVSLLEQSGLG